MLTTDRSYIALTDRDEPVVVAWPMPGNPAAFLQFVKAADWRAFVEGLGIDTRIPDTVRAKFARAQTLYMLGWVDFSVVKAGELAALIALELALMDRYGDRISKSKRSFAALLRYMVESDGLTDAQIPMVSRCGGTAVGQLTGETRPTLAERRNTLAHGDPFEGLPTGGLLELVRDLINFAYRHYIAEGVNLGVLRTSGQA
ncbi:MULTISPECIES: hypothetical protein [Agrobacterium]|uniref:Uncharacterized protein n=1 Tax=Agrobacterium rubi TaxID=28099 RepID=A0AAE7R8M0_9HYPH|nr:MULTISPECIES: hypothetical protein [Agrobacterium]MBN7807757.1 hypothetical protein [Agrobacterium rosae]NTE89718.1 hypothetical protein [Agrobacterium rubi]NTF05432.1 hypothetical protein [Agrobacterium rubi]NTF39875.1 hypothetical protein [Agrobacterium rubi]OCJ44825.1 hypothetical protein A6U92_16415 [Agrobacterium rubi]